MKLGDKYVQERFVTDKINAQTERDRVSAENFILDSQIGFILRLASQRHTSIFQEMMSNRLTPTQFAALTRIAEVGTCSQNHLGRLTAMDVATIKGVIDRLAARGLVEMTPDPVDRRRTSITLSSKGRKLLPEVQRIGFLISEETLSPLSPNEQKTFLKLLSKLI
jgi:MarR family transcriptional regulator, lower aerobic nicotinate degradation pathway regulator